MDLNHLRSFVAVAKFGHLTRASEALHLSQPALSSHIKTLEEQFGVTLFERTPTGMTLTPSGRRLLVEAEQIIGAVRHLAHSAQDLRGQPTGHLKIGTVLNPATLRVGETISRALERYPQIELELYQVMSSDVLARLRNGTLDAGFFFGDAPGERHRQHPAARRRLSRDALPRRAPTSSSRPSGRRSRSSPGSWRLRRARTTSSSWTSSPKARRAPSGSSRPTPSRSSTISSNPASA